MLELMNWNGIGVIDSRVIAEAVGKEHKELMRTIRTYIQHLDESKIRFIENSPSQNQNLDKLNFEPSEFFIETVGGSGNE